MSVLIIAEAGVNHNGSLARAKKMALAAKTAGADIVKYQTAVPELVVSKFAEKAEYQKAQTGAGESQLEMVRRIHFGFDGHRELKAYCEEIGIEYLSTPFDLDSIDFLASLELPVYKIPSGEITNLPYLERIAALKKPVILSTGMSTLAEIEDAMSVLEDGGVEDITLLHCNTEYPTPFADANLRAIVETLIDGTFDDDGTGMFKELYTSLTEGASWHKPDNYFLIYDEPDYVKTKLRAIADYQDRRAFGLKCLRNIAGAGKFSSDRTIQQYAKELWKL